MFYTELYPNWKKTVENTGEKFYPPSINTSKWPCHFCFFNASLPHSPFSSSYDPRF